MMELKYATEDDKIIGWTLDYRFLESIQRDIEDTAIADETPSLEQIENTLISFEKLYK